GYIYEELLRRFSEQSGEEAGEHFTPREVIRLMVELLAIPIPDRHLSIYDPACGTGGMLSVAQEYLAELNPDATLEVFGQELNEESYAICKSDMMLKGQDPENVKFGNSFTHDGLPDDTFHYCISNPPFGVEWKTAAPAIKAEHEARGYAGRFGAGLPRINDGSLLFLQHMISKMKQPEDGGSRVAIVFNGSPLFTGAAGSGESEIRRWIIENDWLEAVVAMPDQLFYNTGIFTYLWIVTNRKPKRRRGKIQLINAVSLFQKMRKSLGQKRHELSEEHIAQVTRIYGEFHQSEYSKIFDNEDFGFRKIRVERPLRLKFQVTPERIEALRAVKAFENLATSKKKKGSKAAQAEIEEGRRQQEAIVGLLQAYRPDDVYMDREAFVDGLKASAAEQGIKLAAPVLKAILATFSERDEEAEVCQDRDLNPEPDPELRDYEEVPLKEDVQEYFAREVLPHVPDAWIDEEATKIGYEIPLNRHFYQYTPPRPLEEIEADIKEVEKDIVQMLAEVTG
ncbi:MAG: N-6 DNA methylase, partial [Planctomycetes bacterium]|nr:N-6 DNA methylase [Planctomycetota bacterium]